MQIGSLLPLCSFSCSWKFPLLWWSSVQGCRSAEHWKTGEVHDAVECKVERDDAVVSYMLICRFLWSFLHYLKCSQVKGWVWDHYEPTAPLPISSLGVIVLAKYVSTSMKTGLANSVNVTVQKQGTHFTRFYCACVKATVLCFTYSSGHRKSLSNGVDWILHWTWPQSWSRFMRITSAVRSP